MTDPTTPSSPEPSTPPAYTPASSTPPASTPAGPSTPPAYTPAAGAVGAPPKRGLSIAGFIVGIVSVVLFWSSWFAILVGVVGLILSLIARSKEPASPNWMKLLGLIFSIVGIVLGAIVLIFVILAFVAAANAGYSNQ